MLDDPETAPISESLRATLAFLRRLILHPDRTGPDHARAVLETGVSASALRDAVQVCAVFSTINRIVDALGIEALPDELARRGASFTVRGYA